MTPAQRGWHWREWIAELTGTALLLLVIVSATYLTAQGDAWFVSSTWRTVLVAVVAGGTVVVIAYSPLGRRSGAHLNPAVTLGLWVLRTVSASDLAGYFAAQSVGAALGVGLARLWGPAIELPPVRWAVVRPAPDLQLWLGAVLELAVVLAQLLLVFWFLLDPGRARWAALVAGAGLVVGVVGLAQWSGAGLNPVRVLLPDVYAGTYPALWIFLVGPGLGSVLAGCLLLRRGRLPATGKLRHDGRVPCRMRCGMRHRPPR